MLIVPRAEIHQALLSQFSLQLKFFFEKIPLDPSTRRLRGETLPPLNSRHPLSKKGTWSRKPASKTPRFKKDHYIDKLPNLTS